jgi:hypothetical protein
MADRARDSGGLVQGLFEVALSAGSRSSSQGDLRESGGERAMAPGQGVTMESIPTTEVSMSTIDQEMVLAHFIVSDDVERSRRFYTEVLGATPKYLAAGPSSQARETTR